MLHLLAIWLLVSPPVTKVEWYDPGTDPCRGMATEEWRRCQPRVINLGPWDPVYHKTAD